MHDPKSIKVMRQAYEGTLKLDDIAKLKTRKLRVYAAVGYILRHPDQYLEEGYRLNRPYNLILEEIIAEEYSGIAVNVSLEAGLHKRSTKGTARWGGVTLTPPTEVVGKSVVSDHDQAKATALVKKILAEGLPVAQATYQQLKEFFDK